MRTHNSSGRSPACVECGDMVAEARWALGYRECMKCGEYRARQRVHTVVPMAKSNYILVTDKSLLRGLNKYAQY